MLYWLRFLLRFGKPTLESSLFKTGPQMLTPKQKKRFRAIGHTLRPVVTIAEKGLTDNVNGEIDRALNDHELIKLKIVADDRHERSDIISLIATTHELQVIQKVGGIALVYRAAKKPNPALSNILRSNIF
jgi:RNA-binding protein